jgi:hypothetical protein
MSERQSDFDPRFDPAFQRGFDGEVAQAPAVRPVVRPTHPSGGRSTVGPERELEAGPLDEPTTLLADAVHPQLPSLRGNPWMRVLWAVAAVFTIGGVVATWQSQVLFSTPNGENALDYYVWPTLLQTLAPWFTFAGLVAGIGAVFLHASRWRDES